MLAGHQVGGAASAEEEAGIVAQMKVIAQVQRDLHHVEGALDQVDFVNIIHGIIARGDMIIIGAGSVVLPGEEDPCAEIEPVQELVVQGDADAAAGSVAGKGTDGSEVRGEGKSYLQGSVDEQGCVLLFIQPDGGGCGSSFERKGSQG